MKIALSSLCVLLLCSTALYARDAFVGTWKVVITPGADASGPDAKEIKDVFTFKGSKFESAEFKKKGFEPTTYNEDTRGGIMATFNVEIKSKEQGTTAWTGTSTGTELTGEVKWTKPDGTEALYTFKGTKQQ